MFLDGAECRRMWRGSARLKSGGGMHRDHIILGGFALWTFCSSHQPLRKHSVPSGAGTGRLHLERYQVFKNKGMCFPFAADLSAEVFLLQSCKCFHPGCRQGVSNFLSPISMRFPLCHDSRIVWGGKVCGRVNEGKLCPHFRATLWKFNVWLWVWGGGWGVKPRQGYLCLQG